MRNLSVQPSRWFAQQRLHHSPMVPVFRLEVESWVRAGEVLSFAADRVYVPQRATTIPHNSRCDCLDCTGRIR